MYGLNGLAGPQINDLARLVTFCDIYAALIERRPYRPAVALLRERSRKLPRGQQRWPRLIACNQNQPALMTVGPSIIKGTRNLDVISYQVAQGS
jgi:hypothetical protein